MNPVALITGASRGIGRGIALELARGGYDVLINYATHTAMAEQTAAECQAAAAAAGHEIRAQPHRADIAVAAEREDLLNLARAAFGRLDLLVNNAGIAPAARTDLLEATEPGFDRVMAVNVKGPYFLTQLVARWMIDSGRRPETIEPSSAAAGLRTARRD